MILCALGSYNGFRELISYCSVSAIAVAQPQPANPPTPNPQPAPPPAPTHPHPQTPQPHHHSNLHPEKSHPNPTPILPFLLLSWKTTKVPNDTQTWSQVQGQVQDGSGHAGGHDGDAGKQGKKEKREKLVATNYGFNMYVDGKDFTVSNIIAVTGTWEPHYIHLMGRLVKPGDNVLNLGSQSGLQALVLGKIIGPTGKLFIFQPYSFSNMLVTKNIQLNNLSAITTIHKIAASDHPTTLSLVISYWNTGGSQALPLQQNITRLYDPNQVQKVQADTVDNLLPADVKLDFVLIDVEKMEVEVLRGMKGVIGRSEGLVIMCQWQFAGNPRRNREQAVEILEWMVARGYRMYSYDGGEVRKCKLGLFQEYKSIEDVLKVSFGDIFFFPPGVPLPTDPH